MNKTRILAGDSTFTIACPDNEHRTYRVKHRPAEGKWREMWFVSMLTGSDNETDYSYLGSLNTHTGQLQLTAKSKLPADSFPVRLLNRVLARIWSDDLAAVEVHGYKVHHAGKCCRCGRKLTTLASCELGIGPECAKEMGLAAEYAAAGVAKEQADVIAQSVTVDPVAERPEEKAEFARLEAEQERRAYEAEMRRDDELQRRTWFGPGNRWASEDALRTAERNA